MKKLILSILAGAAVATSVNAQDDVAPAAAPLVLSGSVDSYYRTTLNTNDQDASAPTPGSSFAGGTGFNIGMINLVASKEGEKSGFVADVVFGPRGDEATFANDNGVNGSANVVNQLYAYWNINDQLTFTLGNFNTFLGYEVISPSVNFNYSTSYMFSYGPFSHTGAKLDIAATDELSFMVAALNPTDQKTLAGGNNMYFGAQVGYALDNGGVWINYLGGNGGEDGSDTTGYHQIDLTTGFNFTDELYLGLNATLARQKIDPNNDADGAIKNAGFFGVAGYAQYAINDMVSIGGRAEYFSEKNSGQPLYSGAGLFSKTASDTDPNTTGSVMDLTLSANVKFGDLTLIPELRADFFLNGSDDDMVAAQDGTFVGTDVRGNSNTAVGSIALAAVYTF